MIKKLFKRIFCKHEWEKVWFESSWRQTERSYVEESWYCKCKKCGKRKFVTFVNPDVLIDGKRM